MNAYSSDFHVPGAQPTGDAQFSRSPETTLGQQWAALADAGMAVAALAGVDLQTDKDAGRLAAFPGQVEAAGGWKMELARNGIVDLCAFMQPGLSALLAAGARGQDAQPAAMTLWHEFSKARDALLALVPQPEDAA